jgi:hypothetical protein
VTGLAAVVLAHRDAPQVRRLIAALGDVPVSLHCDIKAPTEVAAAMAAGWDSRVELLHRSSGSLNSWSLVRIELDALRSALRHSAAEHIVVLSGADYPLLGVDALRAALTPWAGRSFLLNRPVPFEHWSVDRHPDGGQWRTAHRFLTRGDDLMTIRGVPVRFPWKRPLPEHLSVRASSQWKIYGRDDATRLLATLDERPDLVRFWRSTLVPDESCVASILSSPELTGGPELPECHGSPWYIKWGQRGAHHPEWLVDEDFQSLVEALAAPEGDPVGLTRPQPHRIRPFFARKFDSDRSAALLDRIDAELH